MKVQSIHSTGSGTKIQIFNYGNCKRDFTFVGDIVEGVVRVMQHAPEKQVGEDGLPGQGLRDRFQNPLKKAE